MEEKVVTLILKNGKSTGIMECNIDEWSGICYRIPRSELKEALELEYIKFPGIYILFGNETDTALPLAYIGETERLDVRLLSHNRNKDFWNECLVFTSENQSINKAHIKYIESILYNDAVLCNRYVVKNDNRLGIASLDRANEILASKFIEKIKLVTSTLGYRLFDKVVNTEEVRNNNILYLTINGVNYARGIITDEGFVVLSGSKIREGISSSISPSLVNFCERERSSLDIEDGMFVSNHLFSSPSMAAVAILGRNANGYNEWKNKDGVALSKLIDISNS